MSRFFQNRKISYRYSKLVLIILMIGSVFLMKAVWNAYGEMIHTREQASALQQEFDSISVRAHELSQNVSLLGTDEGVEKEIRKKFGVVKEGERVVVIIEEKPVEQKDTPLEKQGFLGSIFTWVKNLIQ